MPKYFPSVTHAMVRTVSSKEDMDAMTGILAFVDLVCGPDDENGIRMIAVKKMTGPISGLTAHIPKTVMVTDGKKSWTPVFEGEVADELKCLALVAVDRVKQQFGLKFGKQYLVLAKTIEEIV